MRIALKIRILETFSRMFGVSIEFHKKARVTYMCYMLYCCTVHMQDIRQNLFLAFNFYFDFFFHSLFFVLHNHFHFQAMSIVWPQKRNLQHFPLCSHLPVIISRQLSLHFGLTIHHNFLSFSLSFSLIWFRFFRVLFFVPFSCHIHIWCDYMMMRPCLQTTNIYCVQIEVCH